MTFVEYLGKAGLTKKNWRRMELLAERWLEWLKTKELALQQVQGKRKKAGYAELLDYIGHLQSQEKSTYTINRTLQTISHYYRYKELEDVAFGVRVRGQRHGVVGKLFTAEELVEIYETYEVVADSVYYHYTDKLVLGLIVFQGLELGELERLELRDIDLEKGMLQAPSMRYRQPRKLALDARQILSWQTYLKDVRPLLKAVYNQEGLSEKLLAPQADVRNRMHHQLKRLSERVKVQMAEKLDVKIKKLGQLRQSRIAVWVELHGLRKAQYLSGLRTVMSVERYQRSKLEDLQKAVGKHHPLK